MEKAKQIKKKYYKYSNPHVHLEYNPNMNNNLNEAEIKASQQIEFEKKKNELIKSKNKEFKKTCNEMILTYQEEQKIKNKEESNSTKKAEIEENKIKLRNFNKKVQEQNKRKKINNNKNLIWIKKEEKQKNKTSNNKPIKIEKHFDENEVITFTKMDSNFIPKKTILKAFTCDNINIKNNLDINFEKEIQENNININFEDNVDEENNKDNFNPKKTILKSTNPLVIEKTNEFEEKKENNENIIDLRNNIEELLYSQNIIKRNRSFNYNTNIKHQINENINDLKRFRYEGILPEEKEVIIPKQNKKVNIKNKRFLSEFEKKRFIKALKNIFTERLGEHNIYIQNICSCGNLQKQLTAIVEKGNLTVYALTEVECANNCIFYKNKKKYMKCINEILNSIKRIKYENFHNKYKGIN